MGRRGPTPKPSAVLRLRGSWRGTYANTDEPTPAPGIPECPDWLTGHAKTAWEVLVPQLSSMGVLTKIDQHALVLLCQTWSRWREAEDFVAANGPVYRVVQMVTTEEGRKAQSIWKRHPMVQVASDAAKTLNRLFQEFGLTPSARTRIQVSRATTGVSASHGKRSYINAW